MDCSQQRVRVGCLVEKLNVSGSRKPRFELLICRSGMYNQLNARDSVPKLASKSDPGLVTSGCFDRIEGAPRGHFDVHDCQAKSALPDNLERRVHRMSLNYS